mgnify:FL=1
MFDADRIKVLYQSSDLSSTAYEFGDGDFTVLVVAENHGDEQGPREVFSELVDEGFFEQYEDLSLSFVPTANVFAHEFCQRKTPLEFQSNRADTRDMNRTYNTALKQLKSDESDLQSLNLTEQSAYRILEYINDIDPDLVLDMHTGTSTTEKMPQVRYKHSEDFPVAEETMRDVVQNSGVDFIASIGDYSDSEVMSAVLPKIGYPAVTIEVGGGVEHSREHSFGEEYRETYREVIENIFDYVLKGEETGFTGREINELDKRHTRLEMSEGRVEYNFELGDEIREGDTVAVLRADEDYKLEAHRDGVLETVLTEDRRDSLKPGNRVFNLGRRK